MNLCNSKAAGHQPGNRIASFPAIISQTTYYKLIESNRKTVYSHDLVLIGNNCEAIFIPIKMNVSIERTATFVSRILRAIKEASAAMQASVV